MTSSASTPMNFIANAFLNIIHDPAAAQLSPLLAGVAMDVYKNTPVNVFSNTPHFETEVSNDESANVPGAEPAA